MTHEVTVDLAGGKRISFETGKLARQAHGAVVLRIGDNVVLATATANPDPREGIDFFPLTVDYREYTYAGGRIPGGFIKREGRPSERELLPSRHIDSLINIMVVGTADGIVMIESGAKEVKEETVVDAIEFAHTEIKKICATINDLRQKAGKPKREVTAPEFDERYYDDLKSRIGADLTERLDTEKHPKAESYTLVRELKKVLVAALPEEDEAAQTKVKTYYEILRERIFREAVINQKRRPDGRAFDQIRAISIEVGVLPRTHGSAIFTRGETQALVTTTLGTSDDMQRLEVFEGEAKKRFMLHYNFPPFSVGEVAFLR